MPEILDVAIRKLRQDRHNASETSVTVNISNAAESLETIKPGTHASVGVRSDGAVVIKPVAIEQTAAENGDSDE